MTCHTYRRCYSIQQLLHSKFWRWMLPSPVWCATAGIVGYAHNWPRNLPIGRRSRNERNRAEPHCCREKPLRTSPPNGVTVHGARPGGRRRECGLGFAPITMGTGRHFRCHSPVHRFDSQSDRGDGTRPSETRDRRREFAEIGSAASSEKMRPVGPGETLMNLAAVPQQTSRLSTPTANRATNHHGR